MLVSECSSRIYCQPVNPYKPVQQVLFGTVADSVTLSCPEQVVYKTYVTLAGTKRRVPAFITRMPPNNRGVEIYSLYLEGRVLLGQMELSLQADDPAYPLQPGEPYLCVRDLYASSAAKKYYRGSGLRLMQHALRKSVQEGCPNRIVVHSAPGSLLFYGRFGFQPFPIEEETEGMSLDEIGNAVTSLKDAGCSEADVNAQLPWVHLFLPVGQGTFKKRKCIKH